MNMIEKVARAICYSAGRNPDDPFIDDEGRRLDIPEYVRWRAEAKAAIEAMREPTVGMKAAGQWFQFDDPHVTPPVNDCVDAGLNAARIWQEMIDAALSEESP